MNRIGKYVATPVVYHGAGALERLTEEIKRSGFKRVAIVTDSGVVQSGICEKVQGAAGVETLCFTEVLPEPPLELVARCTEFLADHGCDLVIGLGGGSAIDTAKMAALMAGNAGTVSDYFGVDRVPKPGLPIIAIPTTAGTGSEVTPAAIFVDSEAKAKKGVRSDLMLPRMAILDPLLTVSLPQALTASTGVDALTHAIECYTSRQGTMMSDLMAERATELIGEHLPVAYADGTDVQARYGMLMGSYMAGIALAIANVGAAHSLAQTLGGEYRISHGVANALFLPYVMEYNRFSCRRKYARMAALLGEKVEHLSLEEASQKAIEAVRRLTVSLKVPQRIRDLGIGEDSVEILARRCLETQARLLVLNPRTVGPEDLQEILRKAY